MANEHKIDINKRDDISRQSLKQLRRAGNIPGIYYSANSKETPTLLCAARLYISSGLI